MRWLDMPIQVGLVLSTGPVYTKVEFETSWDVRLNRAPMMRIKPQCLEVLEHYGDVDRAPETVRYEVWSVDGFTREEAGEIARTANGAGVPSWISSTDYVEPTSPEKNHQVYGPAWLGLAIDACRRSADLHDVDPVKLVQSALVHGHLDDLETVWRLSGPRKVHEVVYSRMEKTAKAHRRLSRKEPA